MQLLRSRRIDRKANRSAQWSPRAVKIKISSRGINPTLMSKRKRKNRQTRQKKSILKNHRLCRDGEQLEPHIWLPTGTKVRNGPPKKVKTKKVGPKWTRNQTKKLFGTQQKTKTKQNKTPIATRRVIELKRRWETSNEDELTKDKMLPASWMSLNSS